MLFKELVGISFIIASNKWHLDLSVGFPGGTFLISDDRSFLYMEGRVTKREGETEGKRPFICWFVPQ